MNGGTSGNCKKTEAQIIKKRKGKPSTTLLGGLEAKASPERKPWCCYPQDKHTASRISELAAGSLRYNVPLPIMGLLHSNYHRGHGIYMLEKQKGGRVVNP